MTPKNLRNAVVRLMILRHLDGDAVEEDIDAGEEGVFGLNWNLKILLHFHHAYLGYVC